MQFIPPKYWVGFGFRNLNGSNSNPFNKQAIWTFNQTFFVKRLPLNWCVIALNARTIKSSDYFKMHSDLGRKRLSGRLSGRLKRFLEHWFRKKRWPCCKTVVNYRDISVICIRVLLLEQVWRIVEGKSSFTQKRRILFGFKLFMLDILSDLKIFVMENSIWNQISWKNVGLSTSSSW